MNPINLVKCMAGLFFLMSMTGFANAEISFETTQIIEVGLRPSHIDAGDINGDGFIDLVVTNMFSHSILIAYNNGQGHFEELDEVFYIDNKKHPTSVAVGDLNNDGLLDIATSQMQIIANAVSPFQEIGVVLFFNNGDGTFDQTYFPFDGIPSMMQIRDINGDGLNDLIIGDNGEVMLDTSFIGQFEPGIVIYRNLGNRQFVLEKDIALDGSGSTVYLDYLDYNQDSFADIVAVNQGQLILNENFQLEIIDPSIMVFKGTVSGLQYNPSYFINLEYDPFSLKMVDVDGDGKKDLVVSLLGEVDAFSATLLGYGSSLEIYRNNGEAFVPFASIPTMEVNYQVMASDYDGDGDQDIAVSMEEIIHDVEGTIYRPSLRWFENDGNGNFSIKSSPIPLDRLPRYAVSADFDNDGDEDIAVLCTMKDATKVDQAMYGKVHILTNQRNTGISGWSLY
jgi:hypothetical protein